MIRSHESPVRLQYIQEAPLTGQQQGLRLLIAPVRFPAGRGERLEDRLVTITPLELRKRA